MKNLLVIVLLFTLGLLTACASETPTLPPAPDLSETTPPPATLEINGVQQTAGIGTYCWGNPSATGVGVTACVDKIGIPTANEPLKTTTPVTARLNLPLDNPPSDLSLTIFPATDTNALPDTVGGYRWWSFVEGYVSRLELQTSQEIQSDLAPGLYVYYVFAVWEGFGDVSYGFLVEVQ